MIIYSFPPIANPEARVLILGTMPSERSLELNQYYGHGGNAFWKLIFSIFNETFSIDYEKRKNVLLQHQIALWDVLKACEREGSSDNAIHKEVPNNFESFFKTHTKLNLMVFNGKNAAAYYKNLCPKPDINTFTLPSTSPANARKSFEEKLAEWQKIKLDF